MTDKYIFHIVYLTGGTTAFIWQGYLIQVE